MPSSWRAHVLGMLTVASGQVSFRQGWREDVAGKHLTADLRSKRSVARLPRHGEAAALLTPDFWGHTPAPSEVRTCF